MVSKIADREWDVIVIGTGMGGGSAGRRLAEKGLSVLFVERGPAGARAEQQQLRADLHDPYARRIRGFWPKPLNAKIDGRESMFFGAIGAGVGGSSAFYAATLERPERHDIDTNTERPHPTGGWPESFDAYQPYFDEVERQFFVCGTKDPLSPEDDPELLAPPEQGTGEIAMKQTFREKGLNPYRLHMGVKFLPGCNMCFGFKCPRQCKMDGRSAGVEPALETGNATLLDMCDVHALRGSDGHISHIEVERDGEVFDLRAKKYVLAAGGMGSPRLLLNSASEHWPNGCANESGLVGKNLMFHLTEMIAIWPERGTVFDGPTKSIAFRDLYFDKGNRYGALQAMGIDASYGEIVHYLKNVFDRSMFRNLKPVRELTRIPAFLAAKLFGSAKVFIGIIEDMPYEHNRVLVDEDDPGRLRFEYEIPAELHKRRRDFRRLLKRKIRGLRSVYLTFKPELNFGHSCGTVRFGDDPATSVLNKSCRAHSIDNLYVADSSFMPTSFGINPSLTIAANAMRVADKLIEEMT